MNIEINKIYNENCLDTMIRMPDELLDLTVTSPPYDGLRNYNGYSFDFESIAKELFRVTKPGGVIVWVVADQTKNGSESGTSFRQALYFKSLGFNLYDTMMYRKQNPIPLTHKRYEQEFEYMFVFSKGIPKTFNPIMVACKTAGRSVKRRTFYQTPDSDFRTPAHKNAPTKETKQRGNVWDFNVGGNVQGHPAQFPEQLANDHIISWSNKSDLVYDPFMGSGTTAKMALVNGRCYIGSEVSENYCSIANKRLEGYDNISKNNQR